jgi:hypothetical protein
MRIVFGALWCVAAVAEGYERYRRVRAWLSRDAIKDLP